MRKIILASISLFLLCVLSSTVLGNVDITDVTHDILTPNEYELGVEGTYGPDETDDNDADHTGNGIRIQKTIVEEETGLKETVTATSNGITCTVEATHPYGSAYGSFSPVSNTCTGAAGTLTVTITQFLYTVPGEGETGFEIDNKATFVPASGGAPEFSTIGVILALVVIAVVALVVFKRKK